MLRLILTLLLLLAGGTEVHSTFTRTTTYADGGTRVEVFYRDGSLQRVTGTAVFPVRYEYGVTTGTINGLNANLTFRRAIRLTGAGGDTGEWTKSYYDMAGHHVRTESSTAPGQPAPGWERAHNPASPYSGGRLAYLRDPDGVTTRLNYNLKGELNGVALDLNTNGTWDYAGPDRIVEFARLNTTADGVPVRRVMMSDYFPDGAATPIQIRDVSLDGLRSWASSFGLTNQTQILFTNGNRYVLQTAPDGTATVSCYSTGRLVSVQVTNAALGSLRSLTFDYDAHGRRNRVTDARSGTTTNVFDDADQVTATYTPAPFAGQSPLVTAFDYDYRGRLLHTYFPGGGTRTTQFYPNGLLFSRSGALTPPVQFDYDTAGRLRHVVTWTNFSATPNGAATNTWAYDAYRGLLAARVFPDGTSNTFAYTNSGRLVARAWARGVTNRYAYNAAGEVSAVDYSDATPDLAFTYDRRGRVTALTQGTNVTAFARHDAGLVLAETNNGALTLTNGYDALLRRTRVWANPSNAIATDYGYDAASRLAAVGGATYAWLTNSPLVEKVTFQYGGATQLVTTRTYDHADRLVKIASVSGVTGPAPITFSYGYNLNSQRTSVTNAEGARWAFSYDALGQLTSGHRYWPDGAAVAGQQFDYTFDEIGNRLATARGGDAGSADLRSASYTNNAANQLVARTVPGYVDVLGRAASNATVTLNNQRINGRQAFEYWRAELTANNSTGLVLVGITNIGVLQDPVLAFIPTDIVTTNLTSVLVPKTPELSKYDADGNLTNNGLWSFKWDAENRLTEMESVAAVPSPQRRKLKFGYDWQGRRTSKVVSNYATGSWQLETARRWIWDGTRPLAELEATNAFPWLRQWFTWGADESGTLDGAGGVGGLVAVSKYTADGWTWFTPNDGRGNVAALVDYTAGEVQGVMEYSPFGEVLRSSGRTADALPVRFSSKYEDAETGYVYVNRRFYDPVMGRWLNRDPIGESGGLNLYGFVGNDPVNEIDPVGEAGRNRPLDFRNDPGPVVVDVSVFNWNSYPGLVAPRPACGRSPILTAPPAPPPPLLESLLGIANQPQSAATLSPAGTYQYELVFRSSGNPATDPALLNTAYAFGLPDLMDTELGRSLLVLNQDLITLALPFPAGKGTAADLTAARVLTDLRAIRCPAQAAKAGEHIALGTREGLRDFAQQIGGNHLLDNPAWKEAFQKGLADPSTKFSFKLDRLAGATPKEQVLNSIKASQEGWGGFTDWELHQLQQSGRLGEVNFFQGGKAVSNPFK